MLKFVHVCSRLKHAGLVACKCAPGVRHYTRSTLSCPAWLPENQQNQVCAHDALKFAGLRPFLMTHEDHDRVAAGSTAQRQNSGRNAHSAQHART